VKKSKTIEQLLVALQKKHPDCELVQQAILALRMQQEVLVLFGKKE
jgi:hypothetical protein